MTDKLIVLPLAAYGRTWCNDSDWLESPPGGGNDTMVILQDLPRGWRYRIHGCSSECAYCKIRKEVCT